MPDLVLPQGEPARDAQGTPGMALNIARGDYRGVHFCPYQSGIWGGAATVTRVLSPSQAQQEVVTPNGHGFIRCNKACVHYADGCNLDKAAKATIETAELLKKLLNKES